jgi:hypothetical protein
LLFPAGIFGGPSGAELEHQPADDCDHQVLLPSSASLPAPTVSMDDVTGAFPCDHGKANRS